MADDRIESHTVSDPNASFNLSERVTTKLWEDLTNIRLAEHTPFSFGVTRNTKGSGEASESKDVVKDANGNDVAPRREEQSWFDRVFKDLSDNSKPPSEETEAPRKLEQTEMEKREEEYIAKTAKFVAETLIQKGDFHAGLRRKRIEDSLEELTKMGPEALVRFAERVNTELAKTNPDLRLEFSFGVERVEYLDPDRQMLMIYPPPSYTVDEPWATLSIVHRNGEKEDEMSVQVHPRGEGQRMPTPYRNQYNLPTIDIGSVGEEIDRRSMEDRINEVTQATSSNRMKTSDKQQKAVLDFIPF